MKIKCKRREIERADLRPIKNIKIEGQEIKREIGTDGTIVCVVNRKIKVLESN